MAVEAPDVTFKAGGREQKIFRVAGSASRKGSNEATLTLVHTHATEPAEVLIRLRGGSANEVRQTVLAHTELNAHNTFEEPNTLVPKTTDVAVRGAELRCVLAPASINRFDIRLG